MGQKVHPTGLRLGYNKPWRSRWFAAADYAKLLHEDLKLKKDLKARFQHAGVAKIEIERATNKLKVGIFTSRPGIIIGKKGQEVEKLKQELQKKTGKEVFINIQEILKPAPRPARVRVGLRTAREAHRLPPRHEEGGQIRPPLRGQGHQDPRVRAPERRGDRAVRVDRTRRAAPAHHSRRHRLRLLRSQDHLRPHRGEVLDLQRRVRAGFGAQPQPGPGWFDARSGGLEPC